MTSCSPVKTSPSPSPTNWSQVWLKNKSALNHVFAMKLHQTHLKSPPLNKTHIFDFVADRTSLLSDETLLYILSKLPKSQQKPNTLVSKRWLNLQGRLVRSLKLLSFDFLISGRLFLRFPNLIHIDLVQSCVKSPQNSPIKLTHKLISFNLDPNNVPPNGFLDQTLTPIEIDSGLRVLASGYSNLRRLMVVNATELGLLSVAEECAFLQELELHGCNDQVLRGIAACRNLQILRLVGDFDGFYGGLVSDIGLTILAQGCRRLVKVELSGCEGSYDGIKAIGQCCLMLEEMCVSNHRMEDGWLAALSYCENLKTLRFQSCKRIDSDPGEYEHLGTCRTLERLHLERCQLRDKRSLRALLSVCEAARDIVIQDCWGLDNDMFSVASICRNVKSLSLEGCSLLTTQGLEAVVLTWKQLERLRVISCNSVKDIEITPALSALFYDLIELIWRPDTKSLLVSSLAGTGMGKRGGRIFQEGIRLMSRT